MKKKTPTQNYIDLAVSKAKEELSGTQICNNHIDINVNVDDAVLQIAEALGENAKALGILAKAIGNQPITAFHIETKE